jgi:hypothetical protein
MKNQLLAVVLFICGASHATVVITQEASNGDQKQQLRERGRSALQSARLAVKASTESLDAKVTAHRILARDLGDRMPGDLLEGLNRELKFLQVLQESNPKALGPLIDDEMSLVDDKKEYSLADVEKMVAMVGDQFDQIQTALKSKSEVRHEFKKRLNAVVDSLIAANPGKAGTYSRVKVELDPDMLDLELAAQKSIVATLVIVLNSLK